MTRIPELICLPILRGPLRGVWWSLNAPGKVARVLLGTYEAAQTELLVKNLKVGDVVFDVGAHVGYYALCAARLVGSSGQVFAFEPVPRNVRYLEAHVRLNRATNVKVVKAAVGDRNGRASLALGTGSGTGHLVGQLTPGALEVDLVSIDTFCEQHQCQPSLLKVDVEGAEALVLAGARRTLATSRPIILLSTHSIDLAEECRHTLEALGYRVSPVGEQRMTEANEWYAAPAP